MVFTSRDTSRTAQIRNPDAALHDSLEPVVRGLGMSLIELTAFHRKGRGGNPPSVQVRLVVMAQGITGLDECSRVHRAVMPRLELAFPGQEVYLEVSSPGIDRIIKDASEFVHYTGKGIRCYRTDISGWTEGILQSADDEKLVLRKEDEEVVLNYAIIAKARLYNALLPGAV